jgi:hypothetical protein
MEKSRFEVISGSKMAANWQSFSLQFDSHSLQFDPAPCPPWRLRKSFFHALLPSAANFSRRFGSGVGLAGLPIAGGAEA